MTRSVNAEKSKEVELPMNHVMSSPQGPRKRPNNKG